MSRRRSGRAALRRMHRADGAKPTETVGDGGPLKMIVRVRTKAEMDADAERLMDEMTEDAMARRGLSRKHKEETDG